MNTATFALILASVSLSAVAQISFKLGLTTVQASEPGRWASTTLLALLTPGVLVGLALYGVGTLLWLSALGRVEVSQAYPFVGLGFVLTAVLGWILFGDDLGVQRIVGTIVVIAGIVIIAQG